VTRGSIQPATIAVQGMQVEQLAGQVTDRSVRVVRLEDDLDHVADGTLDQFDQLVGG
jgi:hypothetical protein